MARKKSPTLTDAELRIMSVIWDSGPATVSEVVERLGPNNRLAYNTVLTTMRILEQKGHLMRRKEGRAHVYVARVTRDQAQRKAVRHMVSSFFNDSPELLLLSVLESEHLSAEELQRLRDMIQQSEKREK
ncbi:MAG: BlaI/MecI/CopY family transcriptional regulator [candidate division Zixibacteria bacterium]|nr:BlaI/MecI/CopY family transcriptional regulator [candidate division Zixibacteria bacterium]